MAEDKTLNTDVGRILWEVWDPIGVREMGGPADEYDSYIAGVVRLLLAGADEAALSAHLRQIVEVQMRMDASEKERETAQALLALYLG